MYEKLTQEELENKHRKYVKNKIMWYSSAIACTAGAVLSLYVTKESSFDGTNIAFPLLVGGLVSKIMTGLQFREQKHIENHLALKKVEVLALEKIVKE